MAHHPLRPAFKALARNEGGVQLVVTEKKGDKAEKSELKSLNVELVPLS